MMGQYDTVQSAALGKMRHEELLRISEQRRLLDQLPRSQRSWGLATWRRWHARLTGPHHAQALWLYLVLVLAHWLEHLCQMYQIHVLGWLPKAADGVLGLWWPWLVDSELLHVGYNALLWGGLVLLQGGFHGQAGRWWRGALALQSFHLFEHLLLFGQWLTGVYLFGAMEPMSVGQLWVRRPELHFGYNLLVFVPMMIAVWLHQQNGRPGKLVKAQAEIQGGDDNALATV